MPRYENDIKPIATLKAPLKHTPAFNPVRSVFAAMTASAWMNLSASKAVLAQPALDTNKSRNIYKNIDKKNSCNFYANALRVQKEVKSARMDQNNRSYVTGLLIMTQMASLRFTSRMWSMTKRVS